MIDPSLVEPDTCKPTFSEQSIGHTSKPTFSKQSVEHNTFENPAPIFKAAPKQAWEDHSAIERQEQPREEQPWDGCFKGERKAYEDH